MQKSFFFLNTFKKKSLMFFGLIDLKSFYNFSTLFFKLPLSQLLKGTCSKTALWVQTGGWNYLQGKSKNKINWVTYDSHKNKSVVRFGFLLPYYLEANTTLVLSEGPIGHLHKNAVLEWKWNMIYTLIVLVFNETVCKQENSNIQINFRYQFSSYLGHS